MTSGQLLDILLGIPSTTGLLFEISTAVATTKGLLVEVSAMVPSAFSVDAGDDQPNVEPFTEVTITVDSSGGTAESWEFTIDPPEVEFTATDEVLTFTTPAFMSKRDITISVVVTGTGASAGGDTVVITVLPHIEWAAQDTTWVPYEHNQA